VSGSSSNRDDSSSKSQHSRGVSTAGAATAGGVQGPLWSCAGCRHPSPVETPSHNHPMLHAHADSIQVSSKEEVRGVS
jgi:hypothetical protein